MILKEISDLIVVDQLNVENPEKCIFFLSHFSPDFVVDTNFKSRICTSSHIGNVLGSRKDKIPLQYFKILRNREEHIEHLSNGDILHVTMFKDEEPSGNVIFHFKINSCTAIYLGHFRKIEKIMWNKTFIDFVSGGVKYLYVDNTNSKSIYHSTERDISYKLRELLKTHTKIIINTPEFGYENLIKTFILDFDFKVYVHSDITRCVFHKTECTAKFSKEKKDCEIVMIKDSENLETIRRRMNLKKFGTVRLFDFQRQFENVTYEKFGLYQFCYSSHISQMEMFTFIKLIQPEYIIEIYSEFPVIPNFIKLGSNRWIYDNENLETDDGLYQIENFAPKTTLKDSESLAAFIENNLSDIRSEDFVNSDKTSTDCEIVSSENSKDKIKGAVQNTRKRRKSKETAITTNSSPEIYQNFREYTNKTKKEHSPISLSDSHKTDTSKSTPTRYNDELEESGLASLKNGVTNAKPPNLGVEEVKKEKIQKGTENCSAEKTPVGENQEKAAEVFTNLLIEKPLKNLKLNSISEDTENVTDIKTKPHTKKKNNKQKCVAIGSSLLENIAENFKDNKINSETEMKAGRKAESLNKNRNLAKIENDLNIENSVQMKIDLTTKAYNPFRKCLLPPGNNNGEDNLSQSANKSGKKKIKVVQIKKSIKKTKEEEKDINNYLCKSSKKKRRILTDSVEAIDDAASVIEIFDIAQRAEVCEVTKHKRRKFSATSPLYIDIQRCERIKRFTAQTVDTRTPL